MYKKLRLAIVTALLLLFFAANFALSEGVVSSGEGVKAVADSSGISIFPEGALFNVENIAPGEGYKTGFTVHSDSLSDVYLSSFMEQGDENLYKKVIVTISDEDGTYYNGSFAGLRDISLGFSKSSQEKEFDLCLLLPEDTGNEYQGKSISVSFVFSYNAKGVESSDSSEIAGGDTSDSPDTGVEGEGFALFVIFSAGVVLVMVYVAGEERSQR